MVINSVQVSSCARIVAVIYMAWGLIAGLGMFLAAAMGMSPAAGPSGEVPAWTGALFGPAAIIAMPLIYGVLGYIGAAIACWIFNSVTASLGGLVIEVE